LTACIQLPVNVDENAGFRVFHACALITEAESRRDLAKDATLGTHTDPHKIHKINLKSKMYRMLFSSRLLLTHFLQFSSLSNMEIV
jgi:hypothetical protein